MFDHLKELEIEHWIVAQHVWVAPVSVERFFTGVSKTFSHYDELYVLSDVPSLTQVPTEDESYTTDSIDFEQKVPDAFIARFKALHAVGHFANGDWLNYACHTRDLAEQVELAVREGN